MAKITLELNIDDDIGQTRVCLTLEDNQYYEEIADSHDGTMQKSLNFDEAEEMEEYVKVRIRELLSPILPLDD